MPIIPVVGRRGWKLRLTLFALYAVVIGGAITVLYPFLLMVSLGFTSAVDFDDMKVIPKYFMDDGALHRKYIFEKWSATTSADGKLIYPLQELSNRYSEDFLAARDIHGWYTKGKNGEETKTPRFDGADPRIRQRVKDFVEFQGTLEPNFFGICKVGSLATINVMPGPANLAFGDFIKNRYQNLKAINYAYGGESYTDFYAGGASSNIPAMASDLLLRPDWWACGDADDKRRTGTLHDAILLRQLDWYTYKASTKPDWRQVNAGRFDYQRALLKEVGLLPDDNPDVKIAALKKAYGISVSNSRDVPIPVTIPANPNEAAVWSDFVRKSWSPRYMRATGGGDLFRSYLKRRYGTIQAVNKAWDMDFKSFNDPEVFPTELPMYFPDKLTDVDPAESLTTIDEIKRFREAAYRKLAPRLQRSVEWGLFVQRDLPLEYIQVIDGEQLYREFLLKKYGSLAGINKALGTSFPSVAYIMPPYREADFMEVFDHRSELRWNYVTRNFKAVIDFIALKGRAMRNTMILVLLTVGMQLTVSPIAAYVLSRFRLQYTYKVLLFLIATMAFPMEVASVPSFLMLKHLHLFNTYWALVLPGLANGFGIFILKSFFDSLPEELFEAARIDGAGEIRQLWHVAVPLIKPILAINVLGAFTGAYGGFMWAFLVCRKEEMWTLMVYLYQFQMSSGSPSLMMAALVLASLPILLIFIFAQRIILRGIILPQFK